MPPALSKNYTGILPQNTPERKKKAASGRFF